MALCDEKMTIDNCIVILQLYYTIYYYCYTVFLNWSVFIP